MNLLLAALTSWVASALEGSWYFKIDFERLREELSGKAV